MATKLELLADGYTKTLAAAISSTTLSPLHSVYFEPLLALLSSLTGTNWYYSVQNLALFVVACLRDSGLIVNQKGKKQSKDLDHEWDQYSRVRSSPNGNSRSGNKGNLVPAYQSGKGLQL